jgi:hypothetical protein
MGFAATFHTARSTFMAIVSLGKTLDEEKCVVLM